MTSNRAMRPSLAGAMVALLTCSALILFAPAASAQVDLTDAVEDTTGSAKHAVKQTTDEVTQTFDGDNKDGNSQPLTDIVEDTVKTVTHATSEGVDKVKRVAMPVVEKITDETLGGQPRDDNFDGSGVARNLEPQGRSTSPILDRVRGRHLSTPLTNVPADDASISTSIVDRTLLDEGNVGSSFADLVRQAAEATKQLAFPLALTLIVVAFLLVQGRVDRSDPKLALAPLDSEHDLLSFK